MKRLIVIGGATATGKTALAIRLAQHFKTEIVSADSRQFYREMCIGTAKPSAQELSAAPHHLIGHLSIHDPYSVGDFERDALRILQSIFERRDWAVLVGGSGLFIKAVCEGLDTFPDITDTVRQWVNSGYRQGGLAWLQAQVSEKDPVYFSTVDRQNPARLLRALEVCVSAGAPFSSFRTGFKALRPFLPVYLLLELPRAQLYERINARVDAMIASGLEAEARALWPARHLPALKTVGYEEFFDYFEGKQDLSDTIRLIQQHSRNYAKRQATWFKKHGQWQSFSPTQTDAIIEWLELTTA